MKISLLTITLTLIIALAQMGQTKSVTLARGGTAMAAIYITPELAAQNDSELLASVNDLAHYLGKMSGAKIDILTGAPAPGNKLLPILIGDLAMQRFGGPHKSSPYKQGWRLVVSSKGIGMMGQSAEATGYAIYELLDRLGCRWYMPSEMGEVIPAMRTLTFPMMDISEIPSTLRRERVFGDDAFKRRNRLGGVLFYYAHALEDYIPAEVLEQHPDWNAEMGGKRSINGRLCWANPEVATAIANKLIADLDSGLYTTTISLSPNDGASFCECDKCKALDAGDWDTSMACVSITDRLINFENQIVEQVTKKYPSVIFGTNAYVQYTRPPVREKLHPNIVPVLAPITYCQAHSVSNKDCPTRQEFRNIVEGWSKASSDLGIGLYEFGFILGDNSAPFPQIAKWSADLRYLYDHKLKFWVPETSPAADVFLPGMTIGFRMARNPKADPKKIVDEFYRKFYGPAAKPMRKYWTIMDNAWVNVPEHANGPDGFPRRFTPAVFTSARTAMDQALVACKQDSVEYQRVKMEDESLRAFALYMKMYHNFLAGKFDELDGDSTNWMNNQYGLMMKYEPQSAFCRQRDYSPRISNYITDYHVAFERVYKDATRIARDYSVIGSLPAQYKYQLGKVSEVEAKNWQGENFDDSAWKLIDAGVTTFEDLGKYGYMDAIAYRNSIPIPQIPAGKKVYLWTVINYGEMQVFVNGKQIMYQKDIEKIPNPYRYRHGTSYDITDAIRSSQQNQVTIICTGNNRLVGPVVVYRDK